MSATANHRRKQLEALLQCKAESVLKTDAVELRIKVT